MCDFEVSITLALALAHSHILNCLEHCSQGWDWSSSLYVYCVARVSHLPHCVQETAQHSRTQH